MAYQMPGQQQAHYQGPMSQQHQNNGHQRQIPSGQQQNPGQNFSKGNQSPISDTNQGPILTSFIVEKPKNATSWEDAVPEQQYIPIPELQTELHKFRRNHGNVTKTMNEIPSPNCRRIINELVETQNVELIKTNPAMQYRLASVVNKFKDVGNLGRKKRQLVRVAIVLEAGPSAVLRNMQTEHGAGAYNENSSKQQNPGSQSFSGQHQNQGPMMPPQQKMQQHPDQHQFPNQPQSQHGMEPPHHAHPRPQPPMHNFNGQIPGRPGGSHPPPPPPPPPPPAMAQQPTTGGPPPPPPPPPIGNGGAHHMQGQRPPQPQAQHHAPHGQPGMPGSFPGPMQMPRPIPAMKQQPVNKTMDPELLKREKTRPNSNRDAPISESESDMTSEDDSASSSFAGVEHDVYGDVDRHERGRDRSPKISKKVPKHRVHSRSKIHSRSHSRNRSQSRGHPRRMFTEPHTEKPMRKHRPSNGDDDAYIGRRSPDTSGSNSPQPLHAKLSSGAPAPAAIHIYNYTNKTTEDQTRSGNASPVDLYNEKKRAGKIYYPHDDMSDVSWDRASGTDSLNAPSAHTAEDDIWDAPLRRSSLKREPSRHKPAYAAQPPSPINLPHRAYPYNSIDPRSQQKPRYPHDPTENYKPTPHPRSPRRERETYFDNHSPQAYPPRPDLPHRRTTTAMPPRVPNPFTPSHLPPKPMRAASYVATAADMHDAAYAFPAPRGLLEREAADEQIDLRDLHDALEYAREKKESRRATAARYPLSAAAGRRDSAVYHDDEWHVGGGVPVAARRGVYERYGGY
ncbi:hypothetical protein TW65_00231 [Stemphylium lycopersici]|nr:hypothetical protein TW65_00231 [Stemphylium lycopersici]